MLSRTSFVILQMWTRRVLDGDVQARSSLAHWAVHRSENLLRVKGLLGRLQLTLGSSKRGLRLLDAQLEIEKEIARIAC
jgi:hypothetical protein